jgi:hypothetical protein
MGCCAEMLHSPNGKAKIGEMKVMITFLWLNGREKYIACYSYLYLRKRYAEIPKMINWNTSVGDVETMLMV